MRTIKFRGLRNKMHFQGWVYWTVLEGTRGYDIDPQTVCEFIGLLDKNGKEIFEGDIVKGNFKNEFGSNVECNMMIYFNQIKACFGAEDGKQEDYDWSIPGKCKVIGNIHENPELMK